MFKLSYVFLVITYNLFLYLMYNTKHHASYLIVVYNFIHLIVVNFFYLGFVVFEMSFNIIFYDRLQRRQLFKSNCRL